MNHETQETEKDSVVCGEEENTKGSCSGNEVESKWILVWSDTAAVCVCWKSIMLSPLFVSRGVQKCCSLLHVFVLWRWKKIISTFFSLNCSPLLKKKPKHTTTKNLHKHICEKRIVIKIVKTKEMWNRWVGSDSYTAILWLLSNSRFEWDTLGGWGGNNLKEYLLLSMLITYEGVIPKMKCISWICLLILGFT